MATNRWPDAEHALRYLAQADSIPHRTEGEATLLEFLPDRVERFVDLGGGDGRLAELVLARHPDASAVALDFSPPMLVAARERFADDDPGNQLAPLDEQLAWLRDVGFDDVDCHWKWRELALLAGVRPV